MLDSDRGEAAATRGNRRGCAQRGGNGDHGNGESHHMCGSATKHAQSGNIPLPFLAAFATHNAQSHVVHPGKPASIQTSTPIGARRKIKKRQKRQC
jgi:hypothetical protein